MARTPDRAPGESDEEGILFENRTAGDDPTVEGGLRFVDGSFKAKDSAGVFNLRQGAASDTKEVKVSVDDTTPGFLEDKIAAGTNISIATLNGGGNEQIQITATGSLPTPTQDGQVLLAVGGVYKVRTPLVSCDNWLSNDQFELLAEEDDAAS